MTTFYKDKIEKFSCSLDIDGASLSDTKVRMILEFENNKNRLFYGTINKNGNVEVKIPALNDLQESNGIAILEVIADSTYFTPWESEFEIKSSKTVKIKEAKFETENDTKVKLVTEEKSPQKEEKTKVIKSEYKMGISEKSKNLIKSLLDIYNKEELRSKIKIKTLLEDKKFNEDTILWSKTVFEDYQSQKSKICCYYIDKFNKKK